MDTTLPQSLRKLEDTQPLAFRQRVGLIKALEDGRRVKLSAFGHAKGNSFDVERGTGTFRITGPETDRYGDVVVSEGMDNKHFRKNPVILWAHDSDRPPIGRSLSEEVKSDGVYADALFDVKNDPDGFNKKILGQYADGVMNAVSIQFIPNEWERIMEEDPDSKEGKERWTGGYRFPGWELLEFSAVPIPAYPDALAMAANGVISMARNVGIEVVPDVTDPQGVKAASNLIVTVIDEERLKAVVLEAVSSQRPPKERRSQGPASSDLLQEAEIEEGIEKLKEMGAELRAGIPA